MDSYRPKASGGGYVYSAKSAGRLIYSNLHCTLINNDKHIVSGCFGMWEAFICVQQRFSYASTKNLQKNNAALFQRHPRSAVPLEIRPEAW